MSKKVIAPNLEIETETGEIIESKKERRLREVEEEKQEEREYRAAERASPKNKILVHTTTRKSTGRRRVIFDYSNCISKVDETQAIETDINYLVKKFTPNELGLYIAARSQGRQPITGHDFSREPDLQSAKNEVYRLGQAFNQLPESVQREFEGPLQFLKFIDNPANAEQMVKLGLLTKKEIQKVQNSINPTPPTPPLSPSPTT